MKTLIPLFNLFFFFLLSINSFSQTQIGQDINGDNANACFGVPVSLSGDGNTIAVSSAFCGGNENGGKVKIFRYDGNTWQQLGNTFEMPVGGNAIGFPVSITDNGNRVAITDMEYRDSNDITILGRTQVFELTNNTWTQLGGDITGDPEFHLTLEGVGMKITGDGNHLVTVAPWSEYTLEQYGSARVFAYDGNDWVLKGNRIENDTDSLILGLSVAISSDGNRLAIPFGGQPSRIRLYDYNGSAWDESGELLLNENFNLQAEAIELSNDGNRVAIRSRGSSVLNDAGYVQVYEFDNGNWNQLGDDLVGDNFNDFYAASISLSADGNTLGIGIPGFDYDTIQPIIGSVIIYNFDGTSWNLVMTIEGEEYGGDFGRAISLSDSGHRIGIGAHSKDSNGENAGQVRVYEDLLILDTEETIVPESEIIDIYPNPATDHIYLIGEDLEITIYNSIGQQLSSYRNINKINVSHLTTGSYFIEMRSPGKTVTKKLIIE